MTFWCTYAHLVMCCIKWVNTKIACCIPLAQLLKHTASYHYTKAHIFIRKVQYGCLCPIMKTEVKIAITEWKQLFLKWVHKYFLKWTHSLSPKFCVIILQCVTILMQQILTEYALCTRQCAGLRIQKRKMTTSVPLSVKGKLRHVL